MRNSWEFPVLAKIEILPGPIRPFLDGGFYFRHLSGIEKQMVSGAGVQPVETNTPELDERNTTGVSVGGGISLKILRMRLSPEFRYTHWSGESFRDTIHDQLKANRNQVDFIVGLTF